MPISRVLAHEALCSVIQHAQRWQTVEMASMAILNANRIANNLDAEERSRDQDDAEH